MRLKLARTFLLLVTLFSFKQVNGYEPQLRSDEYLASSLWTDHTQHFAKLFKLTNVNAFLEFGVGEGTKFYLDHCVEVTSVEMLDKFKGNANLEYYMKCLQLFKFYKNWNPTLYRCTDAINRAVEWAETQHKNPLLGDESYVLELKNLCDNIFHNKKYDVAFVDPGVIIRGSIVNELFDRVDIIAAHDTNYHPHIYGWAWIKTPPNYVKIHFSEGSGTTFWIKSDLIDIVNGLKQYKNTSY